MVVSDGEMTGKITPEGIQAFRNRVGVVIPGGQPYNSEAHVDSMRHWSFGNGEDNPLYNDPEYAAKTRWKGLIASPMYVNSLGTSGSVKIPDHVRHAGSGALTGVPNYQSGSDWEWIRPIREGDKVRSTHCLEDIVEKKSQFGGGKAVIVYHRNEYVNQRDEVVAIYRNYFFHAEREASEKTGKYMNLDQTPYTQEQLDEIDAAYEHEFRRGSETLYWEDADPGMDMPTMVKGAPKRSGYHLLAHGTGACRFPDRPPAPGLPEPPAHTGVLHQDGARVLGRGPAGPLGGRAGEEGGKSQGL